MHSRISNRFTRTTTMTTPGITCVLVDIGGVLLTDGWGHTFRSKAAKTFDIDLHDLEERHEQAWAAHELGLITMDEYLDLVVFHCSRPFTKVAFTTFICGQSQADPEMLELIGSIKRTHGIKVIVVSNEGRELNAYRIKTFYLEKLVDAFISSCYVHLRKPDPAMLRLALDVSQVSASHSVFIDNTPMHVQVAEKMGIRSILHSDYRSTAHQLDLLGVGRVNESSRVG
jgi:putative hydrolase of the HAD superfamily